LSGNQNIHFLDVDELSDIIEIYLYEREIKKAKLTIEYALKFHPNDEDLIYDILLLLNDYELWNDLLVLAEQHQGISEAWVDGHKLTALLHLGMEEDAFLFFRKIKSKYESNLEHLSLIYQIMGESLHEMDLVDAAHDVIKEAISLMGPNLEFYWLQLRAHLASESKDQALEMANQIEQISPLDGETWHRLGSVYLELEESEKAIDAFEVAESLGYKTQSNYLGLITVYEKNGNLLKALEKVKEYLYLYPNNYMVYILAANICSDLGLWKEAIEYIDLALNIAPDLDSLYLYKSRFLVFLDEQKKAVYALEEGIRLTKDKQGELKKELEKLYNDNFKK
jgi:tetratricopeptide (TPR) repeat protein